MISEKHSTVPAVVVMGGPSLKTFDFRRLLRPDLTVIACNAAAEDLPRADFVASFDNRWYNANRDRPVYRDHPGRKVMFDRSGWDYDDDVLRVPVVEGLPYGGPATDVRRGISHGENTGFAALMFAIGLGAPMVYVVGLDLHAPGQYHDRYPPAWRTQAGAIAIYRAFFEWAAAWPRISERVTNCNPHSAVAGFRYGTLPE